MSQITMTWRNFLKPDETKRLEEIDAQHKANVTERRKIFQRCRARLKRHEEAQK